MNEPEPPDGIPHDQPSSTPDDPIDSRPKVWESVDLFQGRREVWIRHGEMVYRLRRTGSEKLYLTK
ncbi:Hemin uptake protein hemP [Rubripirellula lacrimiformis]|uniref:Hemin uptake protein hemP n=1 Tax=Rubripirellula lacrimiformis TaxID=1930273 RepID=A0A517NCS5_9BACT|nr:hemin uptake protein HemP [Rubripirellula lacrimiformis]QDT04939.1 Hemin uptake protein hemP [Rubripirellula lacrimiformis]